MAVNSRNQYLSDIVFTGGGTGGHVFPGLAIIDSLTQTRQITSCNTYKKLVSYNIFWIGSHMGPEKQFVEHKHISFFGISTGKLRRYFSLQNIIDPINVLRGFFQARKLLKIKYPKVVISIGGFVSVPVVLAAYTLRIPIISISCDISLGLATKINMVFSSMLLCAYEKTVVQLIGNKKYKKFINTQQFRLNKLLHKQLKEKEISSRLYSISNSLPAWINCVGIPIRSEVFQGNANNIDKQYKITDKNKLILCLGGSKGSKQINDIVTRLLPKFPKNYVIVHQRGIYNQQEIDLNNENYFLSSREQKCQYIPLNFITKEYADFLARADMVLARAGSGTIWEIIANKIPAALIPLSKENSRGDQIENATYFASRGTLIDLGTNPTDEEVFQCIEELCTNNSLCSTLVEASDSFGAQNSTDTIINQILLFLL